MRIATWNVNGLRARLEFAELWFKDRQPDIVGIQEIKLTDEEFPHDFFDALGYQALVHGQKSWNGVAILSKQPAVLKQTGLPGGEEMGARLITADIGDLEFTTVYCPNGKTLEHEDYQRKLGWYEALIAHWSATTHAAKSIICGDFNIVPQPLDGWRGAAADGAIFHTEAERSRLQQLMDLGLTDLYRQQFPDEQAFSWWDYRGGAFHRKQGLRIDFVLGTAAAAAQCEQASIDRDYRKKHNGLTASDHAPVFVDLK